MTSKVNAATFWRNMDPKKDVFVQSIRQVHKNLRRKFRKDQDFDKVWHEHCEDKKCLEEYAKSMLDLATEVWDKDCDGTHRIQWCVDICREYFVREGWRKFHLKDLRRKDHYMKNPEEFHCGPNPKDHFVEGDEDVSLSFSPAAKLKLLDVGSCYDPFRQYDEFETTAIDLKPARETVIECDFIDIGVSDCDVWRHNTGEGLEKQTVSALPSSYFHIVVFSLLLSYVPSPHVRWEMCEKAYKLLKVNGLLLIITPDSSHQNRNSTLMKRWKLAIQQIGFQRIKYSKDLHLHFMVFRKVPFDFLWDSKREEYSETEIPRILAFPQDYQDIDDDELDDRRENNNDNEGFNNYLSELPCVHDG